MTVQGIPHTHVLSFSCILSSLRLTFITPFRPYLDQPREWINIFIPRKIPPRTPDAFLRFLSNHPYLQFRMSVSPSRSDKQWFRVRKNRINKPLNVGTEINNQCSSLVDFRNLNTYHVPDSLLLQSREEAKCFCCQFNNESLFLLFAPIGKICLAVKNSGMRMRRIHGSSQVSVVTNDVVMTGNKLVSHDHEPRIGLSIQISDSTGRTTKTTIDKGEHFWSTGTSVFVWRYIWFVMFVWERLLHPRSDTFRILISTTNK